VPGGVRFVGRVDASNPAAVKFAWSGTGVVATVQGTKISVRLQTEGTSTIFYQPVIDGTARTRFQVMSGSAQTVVLGDNLSSGEHRVELYRESEGNYGTSVYQGFVDGTVVGAPAATRLIEIVGDSISAGYGNLGNDVHPPWDVSCPFSLDTQSAYAAYGAVLARSLGADFSIIARSGWGIYRDLGGSTANVLPSIYGNTLGSQSTPAWNFQAQPDAVVINLGTNDSGGDMGDPGQPYEDAYVAFLGTVRSKYPNAWIFLTIGSMTGEPLLTPMRAHLDSVVTRFGDAKVTHVTLDPADVSSTGCDYHPNVAEDRRIAETLKPVLQQKLGW
jgi:lysophospholipase L1-like esterase